MVHVLACPLGSIVLLDTPKLVSTGPAGCTRIQEDKAALTESLRMSKRFLLGKYGIFQLLGHLNSSLRDKVAVATRASRQGIHDLEGTL